MGFHLNKFILPAMSLRWVIQVIIQMPLNTLATLYKIVNNNFWVPYGAINTEATGLLSSKKSPWKFTSSQTTSEYHAKNVLQPNKKMHWEREEVSLLPRLNLHSGRLGRGTSTKSETDDPVTLAHEE